VFAHFGLEVDFKHLGYRIGCKQDDMRGRENKMGDFLW
jgi:hypothetical protein